MDFHKATTSLKAKCGLVYPAGAKEDGVGRQCPGYEIEKTRAFVNLDSSNVLTHDKRNMLYKAIAENKHDESRDRARSGQECQKKQQIHLDQPNVDFIHNLSADVSLTPRQRDMGQPFVVITLNFRQQFDVLWNGFRSKYACTNDYWPDGCAQLVERNNALDMAMIALSAQRLSFGKGASHRMNLLSLAAYDKSLKLFISMMDCQGSSAMSSAVLAMISFMFALLEGVQLQIEHILETGWRRSDHFGGALELLRRSEPFTFSQSGFHTVFKNMREMALALAVIGRTRTFLSTVDWMTKPWFSHKRTWRDKLYDATAYFCDVAAIEETGADGEPDLILADCGAKCKRKIQILLWIQEQLRTWRVDWLEHEYPNICIECSCQPERNPCICSVPVASFPTNDFALLQIEYWSMQLLLTFELAKLFYEREDRAREEAGSPSTTQPFLARSARVAEHMDEALVRPIFGQSEKHFKGLTEGVCRSVMANWILRQYKSQRQQLFRASRTFAINRKMELD
ncbi:hypothetical protein MMC25_004396 [Agyrium rufum]|nr:hypothetical protein [Agyrium rufum]